MQGFPECIHMDLRWNRRGVPGRIMTNASCGPDRIDGELVEPCITCRLILDKVVNSDGRYLVQKKQE